MPLNASAFRNLLATHDVTSYRYLQFVPDSKHGLILEEILKLGKEFWLPSKVSTFTNDLNNF